MRREACLRQEAASRIAAAPLAAADSADRGTPRTAAIVHPPATAEMRDDVPIVNRRTDCFLCSLCIPFPLCAVVLRVRVQRFVSQRLRSDRAVRTAAARLCRRVWLCCVRECRPVLWGRDGCSILCNFAHDGIRHSRVATPQPRQLQRRRWRHTGLASLWSLLAAAEWHGNRGSAAPSQADEVPRKLGGLRRPQCCFGERECAAQDAIG